MPTTTNPSCKKCGKGTFAGADGKLQHERRANPADTGGRRNPADPKKDKKPPADEEPDREHALNRRVFGSKKE